MTTTNPTLDDALQAAKEWRADSVFQLPWLAMLIEEVERARPVVRAAKAWADEGANPYGSLITNTCVERSLLTAIDTYRAGRGE